MGTLQEAVVIVTGASRGLGRAIAEEMAEGGAKVVVNYSRSKEPAEELVEKISQGGGEAIAVQADVSDPEQAKRLVDETMSAFKAWLNRRSDSGCVVPALAKSHWMAHGHLQQCPTA